MGRTYSCWMLNCWCITWPVGFKSLKERRSFPHVQGEVIKWFLLFFFFFLAFYKSGLSEIWPELHHNSAEGLIFFFSLVSMFVDRLLPSHDTSIFLFPVKFAVLMQSLAHGVLPFLVSGIMLSSQAFISGTRQVILGQRWFRLVWCIWRHSASKTCHGLCIADLCM